VFHRNRGKTIAVLQVQDESSKNKKKTEKESEFELQMSAAEPFSGMGEMALRN
jgi:hypothetical protein